MQRLLLLLVLSLACTMTRAQDLGVPVASGDRPDPASQPAAAGDRTAADVPSGLPAALPGPTEGWMSLRQAMLAPAEGGRAQVAQAAELPAAQRKSGTLAVFLSVLLPGMGEAYAGRFDAGKYPLMVEGALWLGLVTVNSYGTIIQDDARTYATEHAGVNGAGKDDQYYVNIENYASLDDYNNAMLVQYNFGAVYPSTTEWQWTWDSDASRATYREERIHADEMHNAVAFFVVGMVANRIWSAIEAALFVRRYNASLETTGALPVFRSEPTSFAGRPDGMRLSMRAAF